MTSIHDNNVYAIDIQCEENKITLHTEYVEEVSSIYTDAIFTNVVAHKFHHIWKGNILYDIEKYEPINFYNENKSMLKLDSKYGFPLSVESAKVFGECVKEKGLNIYLINSSYGLSGWVICSKLEYIIMNEKKYNKSLKLDSRTLAT